MHTVYRGRLGRRTFVLSAVTAWRMNKVRPLKTALGFFMAVGRKHHRYSREPHGRVCAFCIQRVSGYA